MIKRKGLLFVGMMLGLVAFALPSSAMATDGILMGGATVANESAAFTGKLKFEALGSGIECNTTTKLNVNGATVTVTEFKVLNAKTECSFFGATYKECAFEEDPSALSHLNLITLDDETPVANELAYTITAPGNAATHPTINSELTTRTGSTNPCNVTTNDLTIVHEATSSVTVDVLTTAGVISGLKYTGSVRVDRGAAAAGTATPHAVNAVAAISGSQTTMETGAGTYNYGTLP